MAGFMTHSCCQKELLYPNEEDIDECIDIKFDWEDTPDANPEGMTLYFFPVDSRSQIWRFDIAGRNGGTVELPQGTYRLLTYNNDLPDIYFTDIQNFEDFSANARTRNDSLVYAPGMLFSGVVNHINPHLDGCDYLSPDGTITESKDYVVKCKPASLCSCYTIEISSVSGVENLRSVYATLDGLATSIRLYDAVPYGGPVGITADLISTDLGNTFRGQFHAFGTSPGLEEFQLAVTVVRKDGKAFAKNFDVTSQILNCSDSKNVLIVVDGIEIPDDIVPPASSDVDMAVDVDGWNEVNIDLNSENSYPPLKNS